MKTLKLLLFALVFLMACGEKTQLISLSNKNFIDEVAADDTLIFVFDHYMVSDSSILNKWIDTINYFDFTPAIQGRYAWITPDTLWFRITKELETKNYAGIMTNAVLKHTKRDFTIGFPEAFVFHPPSNFFKNIKPDWELVSKTQAKVKLDLNFNYNVSPLDIKEFINVKVNNQKQKFKILNKKVTKNINLEILTSTKSKTLLVNLQFLKGLKSFSKEFSFEEDNDFPTITIKLPNQSEIEKAAESLVLEEVTSKNKNEKTYQVVNTELSEKEKKAIIAVQKKIEADTTGKFDENDYSFTGQQLGQMGEYRKAIENFTKSIEKNPAIPSNFINRGVCYNGLGEYRKAIADFDKAFELDNSNYLPLNNRGFAYAGLAKYDSAILDYQKCLSLDVSYPNAYNNLGFAYLKKGNFAQAKYNLEEAEKRNPTNSWVFRNWACFYALQNQKEKSLENLEKAIQMGYSDLYWLKTEKAIESIKASPRFKELLGRIE